MTDDLRTLWTTGTEKGIIMSQEEIERRSKRFEGRIRRRNWVEYAAAALVVGTFGWMLLLETPPGVKLGCAAMILATAVVVRNLMRRGPRAPDPEMGCAAFYRGELVRQRDALRSVTRWYLAPFVPAMALFIGAVGWETAKVMPLAVALAPLATTALFVAGVFAGVRWLNHRAARGLDAEIEALDRATA